MTDFNEMFPLIKSWIYVGLFSVIVLAVCLCVYPLIPTADVWALHRYVVMRSGAVAFANIALPGTAIAFDLVTPGGSFIAKVVNPEYGPAAVVASLLISVALVLCFV
jgi:hypothetical protein